MPRSNRISVLIVDDMADTRNNVQKLLQFEKDIEVVGTAANGTQAVELAQQLPPNIVVMDVHMPGMDGIETRRGDALAGPAVPGRDDVGQRGAGPPPTGDARRSARVSRQALLRRGTRPDDPPRLRARRTSRRVPSPRRHRPSIRPPRPTVESSPSSARRAASAGQRSPATSPWRSSRCPTTRHPRGARRLQPAVRRRRRPARPPAEPDPDRPPAARRRPGRRRSARRVHDPPRHIWRRGAARARSGRRWPSWSPPTRSSVSSASCVRRSTTSSSTPRRPSRRPTLRSSTRPTGSSFR